MGARILLRCQVHLSAVSIAGRCDEEESWEAQRDRLPDSARASPSSSAAASGSATPGSTGTTGGDDSLVSVGLLHSRQIRGVADHARGGFLPAPSQLPASPTRAAASSTVASHDIAGT